MIKVYNTLTSKKEKFVPVEAGKVKMYVCGLTVQNYSHIGHIRSAVNYDVIRRYLEYKGYDVTYIQNFTDINEKIIKRAREENMSPEALAEKYKQAYLEDIDQMNIKRADNYCTATENIEEMQKFIKKLIDKGFAYEVEGNVYFSVEKFEEYGKLSGRKLEQMEAGSRIEVSQDKKHPLDFALWKKVNDDVIAWDSPWGKGWPGWHIECSAMSLNRLGKTIDIHGGGTDLIFPHHENEIAQSEAVTGKKPFVKYWLHNGTVDIKGEKMSKSLGNFYTTRELLDKFKAEEIRYFLLTKHYHNPIEFSLEEIKNQSKSLNRILNTRKNLKRILNKKENKNTNNKFKTELDIDYYQKQFEQAMDDDFNTAKAIGILNELVKNVNVIINNHDFVFTLEVESQFKKADKLLEQIFKILGLGYVEKTNKYQDKMFLQLIEYILDLRKEAREQKNWDLADKIRDDLDEMGIKVKDTPHGAEWEIEVDENGSKT